MSARHHAVPAARTTLQRVRVILTVAFTVTNAIGLLVFAWLAIHLDAQNSEQSLDSNLRLTTRTVISRVSFSGPNNTLNLRNLVGSKFANENCFDLLPGSGPEFLGRVFRTDTCLVVPLSVSNQMATLATKRNSIVRTDTEVDGHTLRVLAEPFGAGPQSEAAVVTAVDAEGAIAGHRHMEIALSIGCVVVIIGLAVFGHLVSVRAMAPAVNMLDQQELFLAESAHDLRTPVAALRAITETAMDNADQRGVLLTRAVALTHRMSDIIDDLLIRARLAAGVEQLNLQPVRLDQLVAGVVDDLPANAEAEVYLTGAPSTVAADYPLLRRAIGNLIDNARKYGRRPGERALVEVDVRGGRIIVADHGPGMHTALGSTPFARRDRTSPESTGLGLPIVRWVADAHGGTLRVHNAPDGGAVFVMTLPSIES